MIVDDFVSFEASFGLPTQGYWCPPTARLIGGVRLPRVILLDRGIKGSRVGSDRSQGRAISSSDYPYLPTNNFFPRRHLPDNSFKRIHIHVQSIKIPKRLGHNKSLPPASIAFHSTCLALMDQMEVEAMQIPEERRGEGVTLRAVREEGTLAISIKYIDALSDDHFTSLNGSSKH